MCSHDMVSCNMRAHFVGWCGSSSTWSVSVGCLYGEGVKHDNMGERGSKCVREIE